MRQQNEELREKRRKEEKEQLEKLRNDQLWSTFSEAKKMEASNHAKFVEKIYVSFCPLNMPDIPKYEQKKKEDQYNNDNTDYSIDEIKSKLFTEKRMKSMTRSERIWRSADCSETSYTREIEKLKINTYQYGKKKLVDEFRDLAFNDDLWVIARRRKSFSDSSRSSSVPSRRIRK
jgi:hypothetical protein